MIFPRQKEKSVRWGQFLFFFEYPASLNEIKQTLVIQIWIRSPEDQELSRERRERDMRIAASVSSGVSYGYRYIIGEPDWIM